MNSQIKEFKKQLKESQNIVFFGGAGVSTASGIPDFRSAEGLFMKESKHNYPAEEIVSHSFFKQYPKEFYDYYFENLVYQEAKPNEAHEFLAKLEAQGKNVTVVTQNIDGLHQKAGSKNVLELHGTTLYNHCLECGNVISLKELKRDDNGIPRCPLDGGMVRPDITLYGEVLNQEAIKRSLESIQKADMLIVAGTSLSVYPAAGMIDWFDGEHFVIVNKTPIDVRKANGLVFESTLSDVFSKV